MTKEEIFLIEKEINNEQALRLAHGDTLIMNLTELLRNFTTQQLQAQNKRVGELEFQLKESVEGHKLANKNVKGYKMLLEAQNKRVEELEEGLSKAFKWIDSMMDKGYIDAFKNVNGFYADTLLDEIEPLLTQTKG